MAQTIANPIWKIADLLRGPYQPTHYGEPSQRPVDDDAAEDRPRSLVRDIR
jgi:hypothetical protein